MDNAEFLLHMNIIKNFMKKPDVRIILLHPPYTQTQQSIIDAISRESIQIIGQIVRKPPMIEAAQEVERLILSHKETLLDNDELQFVVLGQQKPK